MLLHFSFFFFTCFALFYVSAAFGGNHETCCRERKGEKERKRKGQREGDNGLAAASFPFFVFLFCRWPCRVNKHIKKVKKYHQNQLKVNSGTMRQEIKGSLGWYKEPKNNA